MNYIKYDLCASSFIHNNIMDFYVRMLGYCLYVSSQNLIMYSVKTFSL